MAQYNLKMSPWKPIDLILQYSSPTQIAVNMRLSAARETIIQMWQSAEVKTATNGERAFQMEGLYALHAIRAVHMGAATVAVAKAFGLDFKSVQDWSFDLGGYAFQWATKNGKAFSLS